MNVYLVAFQIHTFSLRFLNSKINESFRYIFVSNFQSLNKLADKMLNFNSHRHLKKEN